MLRTAKQVGAASVEVKVGDAVKVSFVDQKEVDGDRHAECN